ncbi:hypothetical protein ASC83_02170 [Acidovorax sp. Root402]|nr:hypothetical protein ASC83_02170 [Acidovorax sp. Root402]
MTSEKLLQDNDVCGLVAMVRVRYLRYWKAARGHELPSVCALLGAALARAAVIGYSRSAWGLLHAVLW